jgi:GT2 family glycosyltransferase
MDVSVIVVSWNTRDYLRECLDSIRRVSTALMVEVVVVDNGSGDGSPSMVAEVFPEITLIRNTQNRGFAAANNQGISVAKGRYVLLLNSDAVLLPGALETVVIVADENPQAGMVGCRVLNGDLSLQVSCMRFPDFRGLMTAALFLPRLFPRNRWLGYEDLTWWDHATEREVEVLKGCFILVRMAAIRDVGGFDENFWLYAEETDWCYRIKQAGWQVRFTNRAKIIHHGGASSDQHSGWILHQLWGAKLQFIRKHRSTSYYALCCAALGLWFAVRILPFVLAALLTGGRSAKYRERAITCASGLGKLIIRGGGSLVRTRAGDPP